MRCPTSRDTDLGVAAGCPPILAGMDSWSLRGHLMTRLTETYIRLRELARRPFGEGLGRRDDGQGMVEYALILVLIAIVAIVSLSFFGHTVSGMLSMIGNSV